MLSGTPAPVEASPYVPLASNGDTMLVLKNGESLVPPSEIPEFFKRLRYDASTVAAAADAARHMETARATLGNNVVLGATTSNSTTDKPKIFKDLSNNPNESFSALFGENEITLANYEKVFDGLQSGGYKKRVVELGLDTAKAWFQTFNSILQKMPVQNKDLLKQLIVATSSLYAYQNTSLKVTPAPSIVADQLWKIMLLSSDTDFTVARFTYGKTIETALSRRIPNQQVTKTMLTDRGIILPAYTDTLPEAAARDLGIVTDKYVE